MVIGACQEIERDVDSRSMESEMDFSLEFNNKMHKANGMRT